MGLFRRVITGQRMGKGGYVGGIWQDGVPEPLSVRVSVQPTSPEDMEALPAGRRERKSYTLYGSERLRSVEAGHNPDVLTIDGEDYEVATSSEWRNGIISHNRSIVQRLDRNE